MNKQTLRTLAAAIVTVALLSVIFFGAGAGWLRIPAAEAQAVDTPGTVTRAITVVGEGKVSLEPDIARVTIGVETMRNTVEEASAENKATLEAVLEALRAQGVEDKDIQTSGFSVFAERYGPEGPLPEGEVRYRVSNNVSVVVRELDNLGTILDATMEAGANNIYGIEFDLEDRGAVESDAREKAIEDARTKAEELATLSGVTLGDVISVSEVIQSGSFYACNFAEMARGMGGGGGTPVSPGQLDLVMQLQVVYAITQ
jgi:uncharacterized protein YggE